MEGEVQYAVVQFINTNEVSVLPINWLIDDEKCWWPPGKDTRTSIIRRAIPKENWETFKICLLDTYDSYDVARSAERAFAKSSTDEELGIQRPLGKRRVLKKIARDFVHHTFSLPNLKKFHDEETAGRNFASVASSARNSEGEADDSLQQTSNSDYPVDHQDHQDVGNIDACSSKSHTSSIETVTLQEVDHESVASNVSSIEQKIDLLLHIAAKQQVMLDVLTHKVNELMTKNPRSDNFEQEDTLDVPFQTIPDILSFEDKLKDDGELFRQLIKKFQFIGGVDNKDHTKRCLKLAFANSLGVQMSWTGQKSNFKICDLKIIQAMKRANQNVYPATTDKMFEVVVADWLRFAKQRLDRLSKK